LSSEEHGPAELVRLAAEAESAGFSFACISDHFHPWTDTQGQSPFVWSVLGAIAQCTSRLGLGTAVTCPTIRLHPAIVAHAAATTASLLPDRFFLGVGTGENLNEHITGARWPEFEVRLAQLGEAIRIIRALWSGESTSFHGEFFTVENARLYTLPSAPPPLLVAAAGKTSAEFAARNGDGLITVAPQPDVVENFTRDAAPDAPRYGQLHVCWAADEHRARETALHYWPNGAIPGSLSQELPTPQHFEQAARLVTADAVADSVVCGPDPQRHLDAIEKFEHAGFDHVFVHQIGPEQKGFLAFYQREILPKVA
jgi:G6PDH family F420-dependent oxidoreductase